MIKQDAINRLAKRVESLRKEKNLTQSQLASAINKPVLYIEQLERAELNPWVTDLFYIAKALEIKIADFFACLDIDNK